MIECLKKNNLLAPEDYISGPLWKRTACVVLPFCFDECLTAEASRRENSPTADKTLGGQDFSKLNIVFSTKYDPTEGQLCHNFPSALITQWKNNTQYIANRYANA